MTCEQAHTLLHAYIDDELDIATALEIQKHLPDCPACRNELEAAEIVRRAAAQSAPYYPIPPEFRASLVRAIRSDSRAMQAPPSSPPLAHRWNKPMAFSGLAAALLLIIASVVLLAPPAAPRGQIDELIASHVRSLEADHLLDVASTDQHTVKPWFNGKLEFAPPVIDLAPAGFPLIGGRLDYLQDQKVAALVYRRNKHTINVFIWPGSAPAEVQSRQGYNLIRFQCKDMVCWAVSDLNTAELQQLVDLFQAQKSPSTRS